MPSFPCRTCDAGVHRNFCDLGLSPLSNAYIEPTSTAAERLVPLHAFVCETCLLVQLQLFETPASIFEEYAYFSSFSTSWLEHARAYVHNISARLGLGESSFVVEAASNDGYLLRNFVESGIPVLGIEPAANVAAVAREKGVRTETCFLGAETGSMLQAKYGKADLVIGNNVIAHVPDLHDFIAGVEALLKPGAVATFEFPHLLRLIEGAQFDTIYHEHFSYFSLHAIERAFAMHGMSVFDIDELDTHGGSLRIYVQKGNPELSERVHYIRAVEKSRGLLDLETYSRFQSVADARRDSLLAFLRETKREGKTIAGYGAPAKGNTLLNYCGVTTDLLPFTVDRNPYKQGRLLPGSRVPIFAPDAIFERRPDRVLILPWNLRGEIEREMAGVREWQARFVVAIPELEIF